MGDIHRLLYRSSHSKSHWVLLLSDRHSQHCCRKDHTRDEASNRLLHLHFLGNSLLLRAMLPLPMGNIPICFLLRVQNFHRRALSVSACTYRAVCNRYDQRKRASTTLSANWRYFCLLVHWSDYDTERHRTQTPLYLTYRRTCQSAPSAHNFVM